MSSSRQVKVVDVADLKPVQPVPGISVSALFGDQLMMTFVELEPNVILPAHQHANEQIGTVIRGELKITIAGIEHHITPGRAFFIPADVEHSAIAGPAGCTTFEGFSPPREAYMVE